MNLVLFVDSLRVGGTQRQILALASGMASKGHDVLLLTVFPGGRFWDEAAGRDDLRLSALFPERPLRKSGRVMAYLLAPLRLRRLLRSVRPDVTYSMLDVGNLLARLATFGLNNHSVLVWGLRGSERQPGLRAAIVLCLCRVLSSGVSLAVSNSNKGLTAYQESGFRFQKSFVIHNGFDTEYFRFDIEGRQLMRAEWGIRDNQVVVGLVGRIDPMKGHGTFVSMCAALGDQDQALRFVCIGPGSDAAKAGLANRVRDANLGGRFSIVDGTQNMRSVYSALDIVVSVSTAEGFSNVVGEAMACERACVVTQVGDAEELVGDCGILVRPGDTKALVSAISGVAGHDNEMGKCGRRRIVKQFSIDKMVSSTQQILEHTAAR